MVRYIPNAVVVIDDVAVQGFIRPGGEVNDLLNEVARGVKTYSIEYIAGKHERSGRLLRGLFWNRTKSTGVWTGMALAGSSAKHTRYFHDGTGPIVHPNMVVPKNRKAAHTNLAFSGAGAEQLAKWAGRSDKQKLKGKGVMRLNQVAGQRAKPFLDKGLAVSLAKQGLK